MSGGRVVVSRLTGEIGCIALTIAIRYAAARRQFGPPSKNWYKFIDLI